MNDRDNYNFDPITGEFLGNSTQEEETTENSQSWQETETEAATENTTYHFTKEQLENQWQPNTGIYTSDQGKQKKQKKIKIKKQKKPVTGGKVAVACMASGLAGILASTGVMYGVYKTQIEDKYVTKTEYTAASIGTTLSGITTTGTKTESSDTEYTTAQVANAVLPSVVSITNTSIVQSNFNPFSGSSTYQVTGAGSGIIIGKNDSELLIVTNNHVVESSTSLTVEFCNGTSVDAAYIKGTDSSNDVAVVAIKLEDLDEETAEAIKIAVLGDSNELNVGENVVAIGNALGYGQSVTTGVVSALNRTITLTSGKIKVIQTDASINGGNSGGALVNMAGEVIGINVAKASSSSSSATVEGMGYAIPISEVEDIINELMNAETKEPVSEEEQGYIGLTNSSYVEVDSTTSQMYNIPEGIYLRSIIESSPIDKAGIASGDVITAIDGQDTTTYDELKSVLQYYRIGDEVTVTVQVRGERSYSEKEIKVTLTSKEELNELLE